MTVLSSMPDDTVQACRDRSNSGDMIEAYISAAYYVNGMGKPHYSVPAKRAKVQFKHHARGRFVLGFYEASNTLGLWFCTHIYTIKH